MADIRKAEAVSENILDAINMVAEAVASKYTYDKTIIAVITDASAAETEHKYRVNGERGAEFFAYGERPDGELYQVNERVRITVPNGDYRQRKIIEGYAYQDLSTGEDTAARRYNEYKQGVEIANLFTEIEPNTTIEQKINFEELETIRDYKYYDQRNSEAGQLYTGRAIAGYTNFLLDVKVKTSKAMSQNDKLDYIIKYTYYDLSTNVKQSLKPENLGRREDWKTEEVYNTTVALSKQGLLLSNIQNEGVTFAISPNDLPNINGKLITDISIIISNEEGNNTFSVSTFLTVGYTFTEYKSYYLYTTTPYLYYNSKKEGVENLEERTVYVRHFILDEKTLIEEEIPGDSVTWQDEPVIQYADIDNKLELNQNNIFKIDCSALSNIVSITENDSTIVEFLNSDITGNKVGKTIYYNFLDDKKIGNYSVYGRDGKLLTPSDEFLPRKINFFYWNTNNFSEKPYQALGLSISNNEEYYISSVGENSNIYKIFKRNIGYSDEIIDGLTIEFLSDTKMIDNISFSLNDKGKKAFFFTMEYTINGLFLPQYAEVGIRITMDTTDIDTVQEELSLKFGTSGSTGSDYIIDIELKQDNKIVPALFKDLNASEIEGEIQCTIYDYDMNPVYSYYKISEEEISSKLESHNIPITITNPIIKVLTFQLDESGEVMLSINVPIAIRYSSLYYADLPSSIVYDEAGKAPIFYKGKLKVKDFVSTNDGISVEEMENIQWKVQRKIGESYQDVEKNDLRIVNDYLQPLTIFDKTKTEYLLTAMDENNNLIWEQPLAVSKNTYSVTGQNLTENMPSLNSNESVYSVTLGSVQAFPPNEDENEGHSGGMFIGRTYRINIPENLDEDNAMFYQKGENVSDYGLYSFDKAGNLVFGIDDDGDVQIGRDPTTSPSGEDVQIKIFGDLNIESTITMPQSGLTITGFGSAKGDLYSLYIDSHDQLVAQQIFQKINSDKKIKPNFATSHIEYINNNNINNNTKIINFNDNGKIFICINTNDITFKLPTNLTDTMEIEIVRWGSGNVIIENVVCVDMDSRGGNIQISELFGAAAFKYFPFTDINYNGVKWLATGVIEII